MATDGLRTALLRLRRIFPPATGGGPTDGQLLARFAAVRDESAFAALVARHGPMVLGVCRRVLGNPHDAEDCFQATFLILARKAASVVRREAVGSWLYAVAYRAALEARSANARRRARERQVEEMPHPEVAPPAPQDWRPLFDGEVSRLPEKYRAPLVLCDLEGWPRREAARQLKMPEGTLSSRLARARVLLARGLSRQGVALSGAVITTALVEGASAAVPPRLVSVTTRAALLVAAGQVAGASAPAVALMKGVMKAMFVAKLKAAAGTVLVLAALTAGGLAYRTTGVQAASPEGKPPSEVEALRKENELLKLNLQVVLEKVRAQETELHGLKVRLNQPTATFTLSNAPAQSIALDERFLLNFHTLEIQSPGQPVEPDPAKEVEAAMKALREAPDKEAKRRAADALEKALGRLKEQLKEPAKTGR